MTASPSACPAREQAPFCVFRTGRQDCGAPEGRETLWKVISLRSLTSKGLSPLWRISVLCQLTPKSCYPLGGSTSFPPNPLMAVSGIVEFPRREVSDRRELSSFLVRIAWDGIFSLSSQVSFYLLLSKQTSLYEYQVHAIKNLPRVVTLSGLLLENTLKKLDFKP